MKASRNTSWVNFAALVLVNVLWAMQYAAYKIAGEGMEDAALNFWVLLFGAALLIPFWLWRKQTRPASNKKLTWKAIREFTLLGVLGIVPPSVMLSWGIAHSSASNAAILSLTIPVLMTLLGFLMLGEKLTRVRIACLALGLLGTLLVSMSDLSQASFGRTLLVGNFVLLIAGAGSAFYNTYSKALLERYSELEVLIYSYTTAALACAVISAALEKRPFYQVSGYSGKTWLAIALIGALPWGLAMVLWMWVLNRLEVGQISTSIYLLPLFGLMFSVLTVHERIGAPQILGGVLTVAGTAILTVYEGRQANPLAETASR